LLAVAKVLLTVTVPLALIITGSSQPKNLLHQISRLTGVAPLL